MKKASLYITIVLLFMGMIGLKYNWNNQLTLAFFIIGGVFSIVYYSFNR